jgi:hypothetical protein
MARVGYNAALGRIKTDVPGVVLDRAFRAHFQLSAALAVALSNTAVHAAMNLGVEEQEIESGITNPGHPRALSAKGSASGITGNVVIEGTNYLDEDITETIALSGASAVDGLKAFKTITKITLPAETHAHAQQVETATVVGTVTGTGNASVVVTCTGMTGSPKTISVAVLENDTAAQVAGKIRTALAADAAVAALFNVSGESAAVVLTRKVPAANIANLNMSIDNGTCTGLTTAGTSADTTAGVAYDTVSIGFCDKLGLPYKLAHNTIDKAFLNNVLEGTAPTVTTSATAIESNTIKLASALNGTVVDAYLDV